MFVLRFCRRSDGFLGRKSYLESSLELRSKVMLMCDKSLGVSDAVAGDFSLLGELRNEEVGRFSEQSICLLSEPSESGTQLPPVLPCSLCLAFSGLLDCADGGFAFFVGLMDTEWLLSSLRVHSYIS